MLSMDHPTVTHGRLMVIKQNGKAINLDTRDVNIQQTDIMTEGGEGRAAVRRVETLMSSAETTEGHKMLSMANAIRNRGTEV